MTVPARRLVQLLLLTAFFLQAAHAYAGPKGEGRAAARGVRAKLTPPTPAVSFDYEGDLVIDGVWAGEVRYTARAAKIGRQAVWRVTEQSYVDHASGAFSVRTLLHLDKTLSILSGTYERKVGGQRVLATISRTEAGLRVHREHRSAEGVTTSDQLQLEADADVTSGIGAVFLFLRAAPRAPGGTFELPWFSVKQIDPPSETTVSPLTERLRIGGPGHFKTPAGKVHESWIVRLGKGEETAELHWSPDGRRLLGVVSKHVHVVPRGEGGERIKADLNEPAATWKAAFLKFGFGYHMAREELLAEAFHWELMYEHETKVLKRWPAERSLADFRKAWIQEFVAGSKNRSILEARRLLAMTLSTGKVTKQTEDSVVFAAHPNFGGGIQRTYTLRKKNGVWGLVRIDSKE